MSKFKLTIETDELSDLSDFQNARKNAAILWDLKHNFWRKWKHSDATGDYRKGIDEVLDALNEELTNFEESE